MGRPVGRVGKRCDGGSARNPPFAFCPFQEVNRASERGNFVCSFYIVWLNNKPFKTEEEGRGGHDPLYGPHCLLLSKLEMGRKWLRLNNRG